MEEGYLFFRIVKLVAVCILCAGQVSSVHYNISFECLPNGDIFVKNPDKAALNSMNAWLAGSTTIFNVTETLENDFIVVGAIKEADIMISLSSRQSNEANGDGVIGGSLSETYKIRCDEINETGVITRFAVSVLVAPALDSDTTNQPPIIATPAFVITAIMWNNDQTTKVTVANLGEELKWEIKGPYEYDLLPTCTANAGNIAGLSPSVSIVQDGCSVIDMVSDFTPLTGVSTERGDIISNFWAFKFFESEYLTISCTVKICTRGDAACAVNCGKRRRSVSQEEAMLPANAVHVVTHLAIVNASNTLHGVPVMLVLSWLIAFCF